MKTNPSPLIVCAFALALTFTTPAFSQYYCGTCSGSACRFSAGAAPAAARTTTASASACAPCRYYQTTGTFAPFGGFFRSLFGGSCASAPVRGFFDSVAANRSSYSCGTPCSASARGGIADAAGGCSNCSGGDCCVDPVEREFVPESGAEDASSCTEAEETTCEPCGTASNEDVEASELERRLVEVANGARERRGLGRLLLDGSARTARTWASPSRRSPSLLGALQFEPSGVLLSAGAFFRLLVRNRRRRLFDAGGRRQRLGGLRSPRRPSLWPFFPRRGVRLSRTERPSLLVYDVRKLGRKKDGAE